jgi:hypothetical protein
MTMRSTAVLFVLLLLGLGACRGLEQASQDVTNSFRGTQQDVQHGIRGEPENSGTAPSASASQTAPPRPSAPATAPTQPAPTNSGVNL